MNADVFSVFDGCAKRFLDPFFAQNIDVAIRGFKVACNTPEHQFQLHAEDFVLFHIGTFDAEDGNLMPIGPNKIAMALQMRDVVGPSLEEVS